MFDKVEGVKTRPTSEELEEAREIVEKGVKMAEEVLPKEREVKVAIGWTERDFHKDEKGGASGLAFSSTYFELDFNSDVDNWKKSLLRTTVHEYGHTYFKEVTGKDAGDDVKIWLEILEEALTQNLAEKLVSEVSTPWRTKHSKEDIAEHWSKIKQELDRNHNYPDPLFINEGEGEYPNWLGYSLSYLIGKELLKDHGIEEFPELGREEVLRAGDELFQHEDTT